MNKIADIRNRYAPIQPNINFSAGDVTYMQMPPAIRLQPYIYCYWQLKTSQPRAETFNHLVVADGCIDVFFELNNPGESYVMGFSDTYTNFKLEPTFNYVGVRFLPTMFPQLFKVNAKELSNRFEQLDQVVPNVSQFIKNNLDDSLKLEEIKNSFDHYFTGLLATTVFNHDIRLYRAIEIILKNVGGLKVEQDLDTGISPRQLRRLFEFYIGDNVKTFSKVVRFQNILKSIPSANNLEHSKLFFDAGYYDQAHFIKDFKTLYGLTPGKAFDR